MASTAAIVFFWRFGIMSRSALLMGFVIGAGVVCAAGACASAEAATSSKAGINRALFISCSPACERRIAQGIGLRHTDGGQSVLAARIKVNGRGRGRPRHTGVCAILVACTRTARTGILIAQG